MLIAWLEPPTLAVQGDQVHRTLGPTLALAELAGVHVITGSWLSPTVQLAAREADVLVLCQAIDVDMLPLIAKRKARRQATVFEVNDHFTAPPATSEVQSFYQSDDTQALIWQLMHLADGVQFSTPYLAQRFGHGLPLTHVALAALNLPADDANNGPTDSEPGPDPRAAIAVHRQRHAVHMGWGGSQGHRADIAAIVPTLARFLSTHKDAHFSAMAPQPLHELFATLPKHQCTLYRPANFARYQAFVQSLDISLAPLLDTPFNRGRSDVKFLEAAAGRALCVAARAPAYAQSVQHRRTGLLFDMAASQGPQSLADVLAEAAADVTLRAGLIDEARRYVRRERNEARAATLRLKFLRRAMARAARHGVSVCQSSLGGRPPAPASGRSPASAQPSAKMVKFASATACPAPSAYVPLPAFTSAPIGGTAEQKPRTTPDGLQNNNTPQNLRSRKPGAPPRTPHDLSWWAARAAPEVGATADSLLAGRRCRVPVTGALAHLALGLSEAGGEKRQAHFAAADSSLAPFYLLSLARAHAAPSPALALAEARQALSLCPDSEQAAFAVASALAATAKADRAVRDQARALGGSDVRSVRMWLLRADLWLAERDLLRERTGQERSATPAQAAEEAPLTAACVAVGRALALAPYSRRALERALHLLAEAPTGARAQLGQVALMAVKKQLHATLASQQESAGAGAGPAAASARRLLAMAAKASLMAGDLAQARTYLRASRAGSGALARAGNSFDANLHF